MPSAASRSIPGLRHQVANKQRILFHVRNVDTTVSAYLLFRLASSSFPMSASMTSPILVGHATLLDADVLDNRQRVLIAPFQQHPERFVRKPPQPEALPDAVWITPPKSGPGRRRNSPSYAGTCSKVVDRFRSSGILGDTSLVARNSLLLPPFWALTDTRANFKTRAQEIVSGWLAVETSSSYEQRSFMATVPTRDCPRSRRTGSRRSIPGSCHAWAAERRVHHRILKSSHP